MTDTVSTEELLQEAQKKLRRAYERLAKAETGVQLAQIDVIETDRAISKILARRSVEMGESG